MSNTWNWRISLTEAGLARASFPNHRLPIPSDCFYQEHTVENAQSDGGQALHGYTQLNLVWAIMSGAQYRTLRKFIDDARSGTGQIYLTVDRGDGTHASPDWIDVRGWAHRQIDMSQSGSLVGRLPSSVPSYNNVRLFVNNVIIINDPSLYSVV